MNPEDSIYRAISVFENLNRPGQQGREFAAGMALIAEGLHANFQKMDKRLAAIEAELRSRPLR